MPATDPLSLRLAALADPTRRAMILQLARGGPASVGDLAAPLAISQPAVSKHIKVLERAGLIARSRSAQQRPCALVPAALAPLQDLIDLLRRDTEASLDRLAAYLTTLQTPPAPSGPHPKDTK